MTTRPGSRADSGGTDAAAGTPIGATTCTGEAPKRASTSDRCSAVGQSTASNRSATVNQRDHSELSAPSGSIRGLEVHGVDGVHETHVRVVPADEQLAELPRLADDDDRALGIRAPHLLHHVGEPGTVQRAEPVEHPGDAAGGLVDDDGRRRDVPVGITRDDGKPDCRA